MIYCVKDEKYNLSIHTVLLTLFLLNLWIKLNRWNAIHRNKTDIFSIVRTNKPQKVDKLKWRIRDDVQNITEHYLENCLCDFVDRLGYCQDAQGWEFQPWASWQSPIHIFSFVNSLSFC